jgi:transcription antitermination factor NusG
MSSQATADLLISSQAPLPDMGRWFALHTRARNERVVAWRLTQQGVTTFLPVTIEVRRWSDRKKRIETPLFSCYVFVRLSGTAEERLAMYHTDGIFGVVGARGEGIAIPDEQIDSIKTLVEQKIACREHPFLKVGQRVRVHGGAMDGIEGVLQACNGDRTLVVSVDAIQRSLAIRIEGYDVEVL